MFKEKYLIFKEGEPSPQSAEQPETLSKKPEERKAHSQDTAEDLLSEKSVEEKTEEVMEELYKLFTKGDKSNSEKFFKENQSANLILEAFLGDKMKAYITKRISDGFEFGGYGNDGITLLWWSPEKEMITEINPSFLDKKVYELLNEETKKLIAKAKLEILEKKFQRDIKPIYEGLVQQKLLTEAFTLERFIKSDFARDIKDIMRVNYDAKSLVYTWEITAEGVQFIPSENLQKKEFKPIELKIEDYDSNLNYKKPVFKFLEKPYMDSHHDQDYYYERIDECEDDLNSISTKVPGLEELHHELTMPLMDRIKTIIREAQNGMPASQIKARIRGLKTNSGWENEISKIRNSDEYSSADSTHEYAMIQYNETFEKWEETLYEKYGLSSNSTPDHDEDHDGHDEQDDYEEEE